MKTQQKEYYLPILKTLVEMGGQGSSQQVVERVGILMEPYLNDFDRQLLDSGDDIRWSNTVKWARSDLVKQGLLKTDSPTGIWEISPAGRDYLKRKG